MSDEDELTHLDTDEARGGTTVGMTRYILGISLVLIIVVFAAILLWGRL